MLLYLWLMLGFATITVVVIGKIIILYRKRTFQKQLQHYLFRSEKTLITKKLLKMQAWMKHNNYEDIFFLLQREQEQFYGEETTFLQHISNITQGKANLTWKQCLQLRQALRKIRQAFLTHEKNINEWFTLYQRFENHLDKIKAYYDVIKNNNVKVKNPQVPFVYSLKTDNKINNLWRLVDQARVQNLIEETLFYVKMIILSVAKYHEDYFLQQFFSKVMQEQRQTLNALQQLITTTSSSPNECQLQLTNLTNWFQTHYYNYLQNMRLTIERFQKMIATMKQSQTKILQTASAQASWTTPQQKLIKQTSTQLDHLNHYLIDLKIVAPATLNKQLRNIKTNPYLWDYWAQYYETVKLACRHAEHSPSNLTVAQVKLYQRQEQLAINLTNPTKQLREIKAQQSRQAKQRLLAYYAFCLGPQTRRAPAKQQRLSRQRTQKRSS